jgi:hypothetical protein
MMMMMGMGMEAAGTEQVVMMMEEMMETEVGMTGATPMPVVPPPVLQRQLPRATVATTTMAMAMTTTVLVVLVVQVNTSSPCCCHLSIKPRAQNGGPWSPPKNDQERAFPLVRYCA